MSLKSRFFTVLTVAGATVLFSTIGFAQDNTKPATAPADKFERPNKGERGMGRGQFGRGQMGRGQMGQGMRHGGRGMMHRGRGMRMMLHGLDLTDAQKTQIQSIMAANKPAQENREEMRSLRMAKRNGVLTAAQQERLTAIRTAGKAKGQAVREQILGVLTPEQKAKIEQRKQEMQTRMQQRKAMHDQKAPATTTPKND